MAGALRWRPVLVVFALALLIRFVYVGLVCFSGDPNAYLWPDSHTYQVIARSITANVRFADGEHNSRLSGLIRPPGYPLFLFPFELTGHGLVAALWLQAVIASLIPVGVMLVVHSLIHNVRLSIGAGLLSLFSPTGIAISRVVLADLLFAAVFLAGFLLMCDAANRSSLTSLVIAGVCFGLANYVKPASIFWPWASALVFICLARLHRQRIRG